MHTIQNNISPKRVVSFIEKRSGMTFCFFRLSVKISRPMNLIEKYKNSTELISIIK